MYVLYSLADHRARHWEGNLIYTPPNVSLSLPEGFQGVVRGSWRVREVTPEMLDLSFTVGEDFALVRLGTKEEHEVEQVTNRRPGFLEATWTLGGGTYYCYLWHTYSRSEVPSPV